MHGGDMYLVSIYFDEKTNRQLQRLIDRVSEKTGNTFMSDNQVPPHITIAAMETRSEDLAIEALEKCVQRLKQGTLKWVTVGAFLPQVVFVQPVLNEYLHELSVQINETIRSLPETKINPCYEPFSWLAHTTIAKQLTKEQMQEAFEILQNQFVPLEGTVVSIGIAKPNPHRDLALWKLPH